jgi:DNA-binding CsgD family transcriptional regulator
LNPGGIPIERRPELLPRFEALPDITPQQLTAIRWWVRGAGYKAIGTILGISRDSARWRIERAIFLLERQDQQAA